MTPQERLAAHLREEAANTWAGAKGHPSVSDEDHAYADLCETMATLLSRPALPPASRPTISELETILATEGGEIAFLPNGEIVTHAIGCGQGGLCETCHRFIAGLNRSLNGGDSPGATP